MKARKIYTTPQRAEHIFTDREEPRRVFWAAYDRVKSDPGSVEAVNYYGVGGIGKSSLLFQLIREIKERTPKSPNVYYSFELSGRNKDDCLYFLAESLMQRCGGLQFPLFAAALLRLNRLAGRDIADMEKRMENSILNTGEFSVAMDVLSAVVPNFGVAKLVGRAGLKLFRTLKTSRDHNNGEFAAMYREIEGSSAAELMNNLQKYFCMDAAPLLDGLTSPAVIMLDGYEVLTGVLERGALGEVDDAWLWGSEGLMWSLPNTLWVIAGRNRLMWDRHDTGISDSLERHLLGNMSEKDSADFLSVCGVKEEYLHSALYELTEGTPVYLDMCVNTYHQLKAEKGDGYQPAVDDFGDNHTGLAERFLRGMNSEHQSIVKLISCLPTGWTEDTAMEAARSVGYMATRNSFDEVCRLSLIEKNGDRSKLHGTLRGVVRAFMADEERIKLDNAVFRLLTDRIRDAGSKAERGDYAAWAAEILKRDDTRIDLAEEQLRAVFSAAMIYVDLGDYRLFHDYTLCIAQHVTERGNAGLTAICQYYESYVLQYLGRYQEAFDLGKTACEYMLRTYGTDHTESLNALQNYANCCYRMGNIEKARELTQMIYEARLRVDGCDNERTAGCINNLAIYSVMLNDFENAAEMMQLSYETMSRIKGPEDQQTIICLNNLAAIYDEMGESAKATEIIHTVYETQLRTLGADHPEVLISMFNLAVGYSSMGQHEKALELASRAYEEHKRILGEEHPDTYSALHHLAKCHLNLGNLALARRLAQKAWEGRGVALGLDHPDTEKSRALYESAN